MVVSRVDERNLDRRIPERASRVKTAESRADDHDTGHFLGYEAGNISNGVACSNDVRFIERSHDESVADAPNGLNKILRR